MKIIDKTLTRLYALNGCNQWQKQNDIDPKSIPTLSDFWEELKKASQKQKKILSLSQGDSPSCCGQITPKSLFSAGGGVAGPPCGRRCLWQWRRPDPLPHG